MKNPKIGERVRIYDGRRVVEGDIVEVQGDYLNVKIPAAVVLVVHENIWFVDRRQCVRLVKKKRRDFWLTIHKCSYGDSIHLSRPGAKKCPNNCIIEAVHVREVKKE